MQATDIPAKQNTGLIKQSMRLMGNRFEISVATEDVAWAHHTIDLAVQEIQRIESLLTTFKDGSETNRINANAGIAPVPVSIETLGLVQRSLKISSLTQGAFDISYGGIDKRFWNFDKTMTALPDPESGKRMIRLINYRNIEVNEKDSTVFLREKGMRIGFGGIGKGYAAEKAKQLLQALGIKSGIVNASGDLTVWGTQPDGKPWTIGIAHPDLAGLPFSYLNISDMAIATSGNYEKFVMIKGKNIHTLLTRVLAFR